MTNDRSESQTENKRAGRMILSALKALVKKIDMSVISA